MKPPDAKAESPMPDRAPRSPSAARSDGREFATFEPCHRRPDGERELRSRAEAGVGGYRFANIDGITAAGYLAGKFLNKRQRAVALQSARGVLWRLL